MPALQNVLVIGATSAIAKALARALAARGSALFLVARDSEALDMLAADLRVRGACRVDSAVLDVLDFDRHEATTEAAAAALGRIDLALICHGTLPDQGQCAEDFASARRELDINATSTLSLLTSLARIFRQQKSGTLAVVTSVAGDRGRQSNYVYGSAKSMVSRYLEGLRGRLLPDGVHVVDIRPGFVDSPMTDALPKGRLWARPEDIAGPILSGIEKGRNTVYAPWFWRYIMMGVRAVPEPIFKRLKF